jgi:hypothetical protein
MHLDAFRQETLAPALAPTRENGAAALCFHARAKAVLALAGSLGWLVSAFHLETSIARGN